MSAARGPSGQDIRLLVRGSKAPVVVYAVTVLVGIWAVFDSVYSGAYVVTAVAAIATLFMAALTARAARAAVVTNGPDVVGRSEHGVAKVPWDEVAGFEYRGLQGLGLWRRTGGWVFLMNLPPWGKAVPDAMTVLREELTKSRS